VRRGRSPVRRATCSRSERQASALAPEPRVGNGHDQERPVLFVRVFRATQFHQTAQYRAVTGHRNGSDVRQQEQSQRRLTGRVFAYEHRGRRQSYMQRAAEAGVADRADPRMLPRRDSHRLARDGDELGEQPVRDDQQRHVVLASRIAPKLGLAIWQLASPFE
jgi:hypothetical protein